MHAATHTTEARLAPLHPDHLDEVMRIEHSAYSHPWARTHFQDALQAGYQAQVLLRDDSLLGYFVAMQGAGEVHLLNIAVAPQYQGQGWARCMLDALTLWSRSQSAACLWLEVRPSSARAMRMYAAHGFERIGVRKQYYPAGHGQREDAIVMRLDLL